jgi:NitT/TauT family transport system substrate-binding protein
MNFRHNVLSAEPSRRSFLKLAGAGAGLAATGSLLAACGNENGTESASSGGGLEEVTHQLGWLKLTQFGGFFAAQELGFYKDAGISAKFTPGGPNILAWQQVVSKSALVGDDDNTNVLVAIAKGQPLVIYGAIFQTSPFAVISKSDAPITSIEDFEGRTIALPEAARQQVGAMLQQGGVDPGKVTLIPAGPDPTQLVTGQADGYWGYATAQGVALREQGLDIEVLYIEDLGIPSYGNVLITTQEDAENQREQIVSFLRGSIKGFEYMNQNPDEIGQLVAEDYGPAGLKPKTEIETAKFQKDLIATDKGPLWVEPAKMQTIIDQLVEAGTLEKTLDAEKIVTTELLEAAYDGKTSLL